LQILVFVGWLSLAIAVIDKVDIGLDQKLSMPHVCCFFSFAVLLLQCIVLACHRRWQFYCHPYNFPLSLSVSVKLFAIV